MTIWVGRSLFLLAMLGTWAEYSKLATQVYDLKDTVRMIVHAAVITICIVIGWVVMEIASIRMALGRRTKETDVQRQQRDQQQ